MIACCGHKGRWCRHRARKETGLPGPTVSCAKMVPGVGRVVVLTTSSLILYENGAAQKPVFVKDQTQHKIHCDTLLC